MAPRHPAQPRSAWLAFGAATLLVLAARDARSFEIPGVELVYTPPVETTLKNPDLRPPNVVWLQLFRGARKSIDLEQMYAVSQAGEPLEGVMDALEEAARRGVKIRFLLEKKMLRASDPATIERLRRIPHLDFQITEFGKLTGRDAIIHAKFIVVDRARAYLGSQNFDWRSLKHVHELGLRIDEPTIVEQMQAIFDHDWDNQQRILKGLAPAPCAAAVEGNPATTGAAPRPLRLVASPADHNPPGVASSEAELLKLLASASREIRVQVMSYAPIDHRSGRYAVIDDALRAAAARGVKIKLLIANWSTGHPAIDRLKELARVPNVEIRVVTLPEAKQGFIPFARVIHSKYCVIDGRTAWVGTSNWEGGYLTRLRNLELIVADQRFAERIVTLHEQLWASIYAEELQLDKEYPKIRRD